MNILPGKYGYFSDDGASYTILDWRTPKPWINVISNGRWGLTISQSGGGYSWLDHAMENRITRWQQEIIQDNWGKYLFLRDLDNRSLWSITPQPLKPDFEEYRCTHGLGWTTFETKCNGIRSQLDISVPLDLPLETWTLRLTNESDRTRRLNLYSYFEFAIGVFPDWHREFHKCFVKTSYRQPFHAIITTMTLWTAPLADDPGWNKTWPYTCFFFSDPAPTSFSCDKEEFLGQYGTFPDARAFTIDKFEGRCGRNLEAAPAYHFALTLAPGEISEVIFCLGASADNDFEKDFPALHDQVIRNNRKLREEVIKHWRELCSKQTIATPSPALDVMVNYWLKYQAISCRLLGRSAYYQTGGAIGFRDQLQDSLIQLGFAPEKVRDQIVLHAAHQNSDGTVLHWWHPLSKTGRNTGISDDLLWLSFATWTYLNETGDFGLLDQDVPYYDSGSSSIYEHCKRAIDRVLCRMSKRGLALIGEGDWNDGLNGVGPNWKGESIWLSQFLCVVLDQFLWILKRVANGEIQKYDRIRKKLGKAVIEHGFNGTWFIRATTDDGRVLGSPDNREGKIFLNSQTWAVISGLVSGEKAKELLFQVEKHLYREYGILLLTPAFSVPDKNIGYLSRYAPSVRENGGVYTHAAVWTAIAQALAGNENKVFDTLKRLCPPLLSNSAADRYKGEPYVTPGNIEGPESLNQGQGAWTWYTGSAAWYYRAVCEYLLGVRPEDDELIVKPMLPSDWPGFKMSRLFRSKRYEVVVTRKASGFETKTRYG